MTGPEHYVEAEELLGAASICEDGSAEQVAILGEAKVHALLALAAATIEPRNPTNRETSAAWQNITQGTTEEPETP